MDFPPLRPPDVHALALWLGAGLVIGVVVIVLWLRRLEMAREAAGWQTAEAKILAADVVQVPAAEEDDYETRIRYAYRVNGRPFEGNRLRLGPKRMVFQQRSKAEAALKPYRIGGRVTIYYDPGMPDQSVVEPVAAANGLTGWAMTGGFLVVSGLYILVTLLFPQGL